MTRRRTTWAMGAALASAFALSCRAQPHDVALDASPVAARALDAGTRRARVAGWVACGEKLCDARVDYCEIVLSDVAELPTDFTCKKLPPACVPDSSVAQACGCFPAGTPCLSFCGYIETGGLAGFHLTCRK